MHTRILHASVVACVGVVASVASAQPIASDRLEASMFIAGVQETPKTSIPLTEERLIVTIDGQHATSTLTQVFQHDNGAPIEGQYRLRPGLGSKVEGFAYWNGEQKIVGEVFEREIAKRVYTNVVTRGRDPGLLEEDGAGAFAFKVFPINPREKKRVELKWSKWLDRRASVVKYRAPITRADAEIVINLNGPIKNLKSSTHRLRTEKTSTGVRLRSDGANGGGQIELSWEVDEPDWTPDAFVHANGKNDGWFALSLAAPDLGNASVAAKDVTLVIDRSGSMLGEPIMNARIAAMDFIRRLDAKDRINVISFSDEVDPLFKAPQPLENADTRQTALDFVDRLRDGGGTDIALALKTAIASQDKKPGRPRVIVFMTDGQSDVELAMDAAKADTGDVRVFTIGLGKDVNKALLSRLAAQKRGRFTYIEQTKDIKPEVGRLSQSIAKPLLVDVSVDVEGAQAVRLYPRSMPDLFAMDELVVSGRLRGMGTAKFIIKGTLAGKPVQFTRAVNIAKAAHRPWVGRLWAQARVEHLLEEIALGSKEPELKNEVIELALAYNFVTPYTAFLAIPESEMGNERATVERERERKRQIMANHQDAAELDKTKEELKPADTTQNRPGLGTSVGNYRAPTHSGPAPGQVATRENVDVDDEEPAKKSKRSFAAKSDDEEEDGEDIESDAPDYAESAPVNQTSVASRRGRGCAGCATNDRGSTALLALALAALVLRRRRRG
jgi:Ca-activated chloride channel family protein